MKSSLIVLSLVLVSTLAETLAANNETRIGSWSCPEATECAVWNGLPVKNSWCSSTFCIVSLGIFAPLLAAVFVLITLVGLLKKPDGTENGVKPRMVEVADDIREGSISYMKVQYRFIVVFAAVVAILIVALLKGPIDPFQGYGAENVSDTAYWQMMVHFICGAALSALSGVLGMNVAIRANVRTCYACQFGGLNSGLRVAFASGTVMGMSVATLVVLGLAILFLIFEDIMALSGFGFGASTVALFSRVGGGIFTKAADVGSDLVGKVEAGLPEDDPRNPGVIADNVGDNVGDVAGLGADLFESYVGATVAAVPLGYFAHGAAGVALPFWISGAGLICSMIGSFMVKAKDTADSEELLAAMRRGIVVAGVLVLLSSIPIIGFLFEYDRTSAFQLWFCAALGLIAGVLVGFLTEYTTSEAYTPTRSIAEDGGRTGPATVIIRGIAVGMVSTAGPGIILAFCALGCSILQGTYGVAIAATGMLSTLGITLATDAYGPVADNAGGIAEMAELPEEVREKTDKLDALGNTTAATGKRFRHGVRSAHHPGPHRHLHRVGPCGGG
jgi:H(+)-translocating pyrophosphatase